MQADLPARQIGVLGQQAGVHLVGGHVVVQTAYPTGRYLIFRGGNVLFNRLPGLGVDDIHRLPDIIRRAFTVDGIADNLQAIGDAFVGRVIRQGHG